MVNVPWSLRCGASGGGSWHVVNVLRSFRGWTSCWGSRSKVDVFGCLWSWTSGRGSWSSVAEQRSLGGSVGVDTWDLRSTEKRSLRGSVGVESWDLRAAEERSLWGSISVKSWNLSTTKEWSFRSSLLQARARDSLMWVPMLVVHLHWVSILAPSSDRGSKQNCGKRFHVFYDRYLFSKRSALINGPTFVQLFSVTICCPKINGFLRPTMKLWM